MNILFNSIVKIKINEDLATGFFMKLKINEKHYNYLLTCNHVINEKDISKKIIIEISYGIIDKEITKKFKLDKYERFIETFNSIDITLIEILKKDDIPEDKYLLPDLNYKNGYNYYIKKNFYLAGYPSSETHKRERCISSGQITKIVDNLEFEHSLDTRHGSSGSPICLIENKCIIGIHKGGSKDSPINYGSFIGYVIDVLETKITKSKLDIIPGKEKSQIKICQKCGEFMKFYI